MLVGSVLPLRQRSIGREGGGGLRPGRLPAPGATDEPLSRRSLARGLVSTGPCLLKRGDAMSCRRLELEKETLNCTEFNYKPY
ncbi:hypothetical protein NDU88_003105 [Pleurodeles waltl]|uniref:Uncharacterized protein n=1 Tax=Pleurodeles waltl TaxID=8319 RepID=A0AAV7T3Q6_PLEWA|nr:hypothetical protein NDU88_003105 [Pleurodeles waltl]